MLVQLHKSTTLWTNEEITLPLRANEKIGWVET